MGYISELRKLVGTRPIILTGVTVIVLNEEKNILLQKRTDTLDWGVIGGALELSETFEEAAKRELYEEAGLNLDELRFITVLSGSDMYYKYPHGDEVYNAVVVFEALKVSGVPSINDNEGLELKFFSLKEPIPELNPMAYKILKKSGYINW